MGETKEQLFDVVAVNQKTGVVSVMGEGKTMSNADAIERMAIMRRGLDEDFYVTVAAGRYKDGDKFTTRG